MSEWMASLRPFYGGSVASEVAVEGKVLSWLGPCEWRWIAWVVWWQMVGLCTVAVYVEKGRPNV